MKLLQVKRANDGTHKYTAVFDDGKEVKFGAIKPNGTPYSDFTQHKDEARKERYLDRHRKNENWNDVQSPGALSRWLLWNLPTLKASIADFKKRFDL